ncbi:unnamed protein product [Gadus morhua 'NCC']
MRTSAQRTWPSSAAAQALADLAHFRTAMGTARGLTKSLAPVHATVNFPEYLEVVWRSLASEDPECPLLVKKASDTLMERLKDPKTHDAITKDFNLCSALRLLTEMDTAYFLETLAGSFMDVVQYNQDNRQFEGVVGTNITIKVLCSVMADPSLGDPYSRYASVARLMMDTFSIKCLDATYSSYQRDMRNTSWDGPAAGGGTAHCANMYPARCQDLPQLAQARDHIGVLLQHWLKQ